ncbi:MAG: hypothetical protein UY35_C0008G0052 [Candidatus Saccharibacteria bacterium GW2011_GWC2_48_9]|nr:MAG: hypothetical protein UY35_C0008G0052 [Candidatus Saccharibacteria bacterium GW2011_GWC2_48_9]HCH35001.1 hypothetical protein [Candidatus Saccharibacteria bacterium]
MREYSRTHEHTRYQNEYVSENPFLDASGLDPAGGLRRADELRKGIDDDTDLDARLIEMLAQREEFDGPPRANWDEGVVTRSPLTHLHRVA